MHANVDFRVSMPVVNPTGTGLFYMAKREETGDETESYFVKSPSPFERRDNERKPTTCSLPEISEFMREEWLHKVQHFEPLPIGYNADPVRSTQAKAKESQQRFAKLHATADECIPNLNTWPAISPQNTALTRAAVPEKIADHQPNERVCDRPGSDILARQKCKQALPGTSNASAEVTRSHKCNTVDCCAFTASKVYGDCALALSGSLSSVADLEVNKHDSNLLDSMQNQYSTFSEMLNDNFSAKATAENHEMYAICTEAQVFGNVCQTSEVLRDLPGMNNNSEKDNGPTHAESRTKNDDSYQYRKLPENWTSSLNCFQHTHLTPGYGHTAVGTPAQTCNLLNKTLLSNSWPVDEEMQLEKHLPTQPPDVNSNCYPEQTIAGFPIVGCRTTSASEDVRTDVYDVTLPQNENNFFEDIDLSVVDRTCMEQLEKEYKKEAIKEVKFACSLLNLNTDPHNWDEGQVRKWILWTSHQCHLPAIDANQFCMTGRELCSLTEYQMRFLAPRCGDILHAKLDVWRSVSKISGDDSDENICQRTEMEESDLKAKQSNHSAKTGGKVYLSPNSDSRKMITDDGKSSNAHGNGTCSKTAISAMTPNHINGIHLWQFLKELLLQPIKYGQYIRWMDQEQGIFKIEDSVEVAKLWGIRKKRPAMNYDKLSRSIRQYYKKGIIRKPRVSQRLVYQFVKPLV